MLRYISDVRKTLGARAVWAPGDPLHLGDVIELDHAGGFSIRSNAEQLGASVEKETEAAQQLFCKASNRCTLRSGSLSADGAGVPVKLSCSLGFGGAGSFLIAASDVIVSRVKNSAHIETELLKRNDWGSKWRLVTEVRRAAFARVFIAQESGTSLGIQLETSGWKDAVNSEDSDLKIGDLLPLANAEAKVEVSSDRGDFHVFETRDAPLFYRIVRPERKLFGDAERFVPCGTEDLPDDPRFVYADFEDLLGE